MIFHRSEDETSFSSGSTVDLHTIDLESQNFKALPTKEKYDLLVELKETRKMNSWGKLHELPKKSDNFSDFQVFINFNSLQISISLPRMTGYLTGCVLKLTKYTGKCAYILGCCSPNLVVTFA